MNKVYEHQRCGLKQDCKKLSIDFSHVSSALRDAEAEIEKLRSALEKAVGGLENCSGCDEALIADIKKVLGEK